MKDVNNWCKYCPDAILENTNKDLEHLEVSDVSKPD